MRKLASHFSAAPSVRQKMTDDLVPKRKKPARTITIVPTGMRLKIGEPCGPEGFMQTDRRC